ncbi:hypothetical protein BCR44DRAFT_1434692 [Catenaria anguillulae PL171]|uniref:Uncharacterized protein n=1 Tax=Catenaria anguillulae PL171 TaxID=765915 RepID=A0A1Y2HKY2_9FUNG|nr:hypothetical protein BCR44DRAFT_1434692 [Catenaria anguillulae PL171]
MEIEFRPDGTYSYTTYLKCLAANCVGEGAYFYNRDSRTLHLRQRIEGRSTVSQYWQLGKMTRDRDVPRASTPTCTRSPPSRPVRCGLAFRNVEIPHREYKLVVLMLEGMLPTARQG